MIDYDESGNLDVAKAARATFRSVMCSHGGLEVLGQQIQLLGLFDHIPANDPEAVARHNIAIDILDLCSVLRRNDRGEVLNMGELVRRIVGQSAPKMGRWQRLKKAWKGD